MQAVVAGRGSRTVVDRVDRLDWGQGAGEGDRSLAGDMGNDADPIVQVSSDSCTSEGDVSHRGMAHCDAGPARRQGVDSEMAEGTGPGEQRRGEDMHFSRLLSANPVCSSYPGLDCPAADTAIAAAPWFQPW